MLSFVKNTREIRSFYLRYNTKKIYSFFTNSNSFGVFMFCDALQPQDRIHWREEFNKLNFEVLYISKNISRFIFISKKWVGVKNLLQGGLVLIRDRSGKRIKEENIIFLFKQKTFFFRFLFWKFSFYRHEIIQKWLTYYTKKENVLNFIFFFYFFCSRILFKFPNIGFFLI